MRMMRHPNPVVSPTLFRVRTFNWANATVLAFCTAFGAWFLSIALWLENAAHFSTIATGLAIVPGPLMVPIFAAVGQRMIKRMPVGVVVALGNLLLAAGVLLVLAAASTHVEYATQVLPGWVLSGVGIGLALPSMIACAAVLIAILGSLDIPAGRMLTAFQHGWLFISLVAIAGAATSFGITTRAARA
ncbi:MFS transporter [Nocardia terrae]|uniref:hypothetical protein n=1 Tax=Nocardia terrae TaxID=2675851 RepID=UPI001F46EED6|nr:hypothetical protein [Nocardia terrae]